MVGASPDGIGDDFMVEIKCPIKEKTIKSYVQDGIIKNKVRAQMQAQMMAAKKRRGVLCVADPKFEETKKNNFHGIDYDATFIDSIIKKALKFWELFIFKKIVNSAK